ncbi:MAG: PBP1A family penicillin-binding protein [Pseudomonadota bacterium]
MSSRVAAAISGAETRWTALRARLSGDTPTTKSKNKSRSKSQTRRKSPSGTIPRRARTTKKANAGRPAKRTGNHTQDFPQPFAQRLAQIARPVISTAASLGFFGVGLALYLTFVQMAPRVASATDLWNINRQSSIVMLDRHGTEMMSRGARYGEAVSVDELPDYLVAAFLATEDRRFYDHFGIDLRGTIRAAVTNYRSGSVVQGGSTITQQLAKNLFLSPDRTYKRKLREALLAIWLEGRYSKDELLSLYLNRIYLGAGAYGVEAAAKTYFGKSAREVNLAEAAMLAGLPKAPSSLAPTQNLLGAERRSAEVVDNLLEINAITGFQARDAKLNPAVLAINEFSAELGYAFDTVAAMATTLVGSNDGDLIIQTTLDPQLQKDAETALSLALTIEARQRGAEQAALISYDLDGATRAMAGGRDYRDSQFNRAVQARRQPGSAFKPFVYIAALEAGISPDAKYIDQPINIDGWQPSNYADEFAGPVRLTEAVAKSINTVSVQVSEEVGRENVIDVARRVGITSPLQPHPSLALGAVELTLEELTRAYLPLARGGTRVTPYLIETIRNQDGTLLYTHEREAPDRVFTASVSKDINHLLYQVMLTGTGRRATLGSRQAMGKTGTTNDWRDAWFVGYTGQLVTGVWTGNDANSGMEKVTGGSIPATIWKTYMLAAHKGLPERKLAGAYPAPTYTDDPVLLDFYADVTGGFNRIARERTTRRERRPRRRGFFRRRSRDN